MTPVQFEKFAEENEIFVEWLEVCVTDFNSGAYAVYLPDFNASVHSFNGDVVDVIEA